MGIHRDLKIDFYTLEDIRDELKGFRKALPKTTKVKKGPVIKDVKISGGNGTDIGKEAGSYRFTPNEGEFSKLKVPMDIDYIKELTKDAGIGYDGIKITIDSDPGLVNKGLFGYTHPNGDVILYPDAFTSKEILIKTLGHERIHVFQHKVYGPPVNSKLGGMFELGVEASENSWWLYYKSINGGR